jgi:beta-barrel assembly-enhancing protease
MNPVSRRSQQLTALLLTYALAALPTFANVDPEKGRVTTNPTAGNSYTIEQEVEYGRKAIPEIEKELPLLPADHPASKYIDALGHKLAAKAPGYQFPYTFKVVRQKEINAFAVPGGPIYINIGTIQAGSEAEVAGVMGHEIAHVVMRHSTRQASRQAKASVPLAILSGVVGVGVGGWAGSLAQMGISIGAGGVFTKYSRDAETEADMVGAQIIYDAGYDPYAMVTFFNMMKQQQGGGGGPSFLASHPDPGNRAKNVQSILSRFPAKEYQDTDSPEFVAAKNALSNPDVLKPEKKSAEPEVGLHRLPTKDLASNESTSYDHGAFRVAYPSNWQLKGDRNTAITLYPPGGASAETVAYGAILSGFTPRNAKNLDDATRQLLSSIQDTNPGLRVIGQPTNTTVNGKPAKNVELLGNSSIRENGQPIPERLRLITIRGQGNLIVYMVFIAPNADFDALTPAFDRITRTFVLRE